MKINLIIANQTKRIFLRRTKMKKEDIDYLLNLIRFISLVLSSSQKKQATTISRFLCQLKNQ